MRVLDATFLIDYLGGEPDTERYYRANGAQEELWVMPAPAYAEAIVGVGTSPTADVHEAVKALAWSEVFDIDEALAVEAGQIANEIGLEGPYLDVVDAFVAAVGRKLDAPVVSADGDLTHEETMQVVDVEQYRE